MEHIVLLEDDSTLRHGIALALETAQRVSPKLKPWHRLQKFSLLKRFLF